VVVDDWEEAYGVRPALCEVSFRQRCVAGK
jgi:hypothetical protein